MEKLMIVDDNEEIRGQMRWGLSKNFEVLAAGDRSETLALFNRHHPKVVTLDLGLPPHENDAEEGFRCLEEILHIDPTTKIIVLTGNEDRENALKAIKFGAYDYIRKPVVIGELEVILKRAFYLSAIERENSRLLTNLNMEKLNLSGIVGQSQKMQEVFATIRKVATSDVPILITGESGTGKELVAKAIHGHSLRKIRPFIPINCGAIPENLLESELFGFEKGAFSGAHTRVMGKVEYAHKGTLFLDEIGELPLNLQVKLLRFLQEKAMQRVGGREDIAVDARIIAATNRDITKATENGTFREDLFFRISVIHISLPALRERGDDIMLLANLFHKRFSEEYKKKSRGFSAKSIKLLESYEWPGNVRELENKIQRAVIMSESSLIDPDALGFTGKTSWEKMSPSSKITLRDARERTDRELIISVIENQGGNMAKSAEILGISRPTLYDLVKKHGLIKSMNQIKF